MRRGLGMLLLAAVALGSPGVAAAQEREGFTAMLGAEGVAEPVAPECALAAGALRCTVAGAQAARGGQCSAGGSVTEVRLSANHRARRREACVDEGFHDWGVLASGQEWRRSGVHCTHGWLGSGLRRVGRLVCSNAGGYQFSVDGLGRIRIPGGPQRAWLALGDSYVSGEGIPGTEPLPNAQKVECARATGRNTDAKAWPVGAYETVRAEKGLGRIDFVPCTGATTDAIELQIDEAAAESGSQRWDLVSLGIGGNNLGFEEVLRGCLDVPKGWDAFDLTEVGCDVSEERLKERVDMLTGRKPPSRGEYRGEATLPQTLDRVAGVVEPGGDVWVTGYPQLVEEVERWPSWRRNVVRNCAGIFATDVGRLRGTTGYLNEQIANAVKAADNRHQEDSIRFHFVDIAKEPYESSNGAKDRHALCAEDPWLNGITTSLFSGDLRKERSFHPKQEGHTATAEVVAKRVLDEVRFDDVPDTPPLSAGDGRPLQVLTPEGLPPIRLGMTLDEAERAAQVMLERGPFCASPDGQGDGYYLVSPNERVEVVAVGPDTDIATARGVRNGDPLDKALSVYGGEARRLPGSEESSQGPDAIYAPSDSENGIVFWADAEGEINTMAAGPTKALEETVEFCA